MCLWGDRFSNNFPSRWTVHHKTMSLISKVMLRKFLLQFKTKAILSPSQTLYTACCHGNVSTIMTLRFWFQVFLLLSATFYLIGIGQKLYSLHQVPIYRTFIFSLIRQTPWQIMWSPLPFCRLAISLFPERLDTEERWEIRPQIFPCPDFLWFLLVLWFLWK